MFDRLLELLLENEAHGLALVFIILLACGLGLPVPEDITLVGCGVLVAAGATNFTNAMLISMAGVLIGDSIIYFLGRAFGRDLFKHKYISKIIRPAFYEAAEKAFKRYGNKVIFVARFLPGLRAPIYFFIGSIKKPYRLFILIDGLAAIISVPIWIYVGKFFGENLDYLEHLVKKMKIGTIIFAVALLILFFLGTEIKNRIIRLFIKKTDDPL